jgi:hypothetical protein
VVSTAPDVNLPPALETVSLHRRKLGKNAEFEAADLLIRLVEAGELERVRTCTQCGLWFMAERPDALYCGDRCRRRKHRQTRKDSGKHKQDRKKDRQRKKSRDRIQDRIDVLQLRRPLSTDEKVKLAQLKRALGQLNQRRSNGKS